MVGGGWWVVGGGWWVVGGWVVGGGPRRSLTIRILLDQGAELAYALRAVFVIRGSPRHLRGLGLGELFGDCSVVGGSVLWIMDRLVDARWVNGRAGERWGDSATGR